MTGESPRIEKSIVWLAFALGPLALIATIFLGFVAFGFWGIVMLVLCPIVYYKYISYSVAGRSRLTGISSLLIVSAGMHFSGFLDMPSVTGFVSVFLLSLWSIRFVYVTSTTLLRGFILRNAKAYDWLLPSIVVANTRETNP